MNARFGPTRVQLLAPRLGRKMGCCEIPEWGCCFGSPISCWTFVLVVLGVLQLIGCIVMLAVPPPEICGMVPEVGGFSNGKNCSLVPDELPPEAKGIGAAGTVILAIFCVIGACAGYVMRQGEAALKQDDKDKQTKVGKQLEKFYIFLWWLFFAGLFLNTIFSIASECRLNPRMGSVQYP